MRKTPMVLSITDAISVGVALGNEPENSNIVNLMYPASSIGEHEAQMIRGEIGVVDGFRIYQQRQVLATALAIAASSGMPMFDQSFNRMARRVTKPMTQADYDRIQAAQDRRDRRNQNRLKAKRA